MKKTVLFSVVICFTIAVAGQAVTDSSNMLKPDAYQLGQAYLKKSKNQNITAWILLSAGGILTTAGILVGRQDAINSAENLVVPEVYTETVLVLSGALAIITSVPFFIISKKNKRKAQLYLSEQHVLFNPNITMGKLYAVGVRITL